MTRTTKLAILTVSLGSTLLVGPATATTAVDLAGGVLSYTAINHAPPNDNAVTISLAGAVYDFDDPLETDVALGPGATAAGCTLFDSNTFTCPAAAITSFDIRTNDGPDTIVLTGVPAPATIDGGLSNDTIIGGNGDDTIVWTPGGGSDVVDGGPGSDTLRFIGSNANETIVIVPEGEGFELFRDIGAIDLHAANVELIDLGTIGGADTVQTTPLRTTAQQLKGGTDTALDTLTIDANARCLEREGDTFTVDGFGSILVANFPTLLVVDQFCRPDPCANAVATDGCTVNGVHDQPCQGTDGDDVIFGTPGPDVILGGGGNDKIRGGAGDDLLCGGAGDDALSGGRDDDTLVGGPGNDSLKGDSGDDTLLGGDDDDRLIGGSGADDLDGGRGNDRLVAGSGADVLRGGDGVDSIKGGGGIDACTDTDQSGPFSGCELP
jgi:Ca2+-binding RTX toxin-like protein